MTSVDLKEISLDNLLFYLNGFDWKPSKSNYSGLTAFVLGGKENSEAVFVPNSKNVPGFERYIYDVVTTLAGVYNIEPELIARAITFIDVDLHNMKIPGKDIPSIPIETAEKIVVSARTLLEEAALTETDADKRRTADSFIKTCRFAHTWKGSFGFTIESPLGLENMTLLGVETETVARKAGKRIYKGLSIAREAVIKKSRDYLIDNIEQGFNVKMCQSIVDISETLRKKTLEYEFAWSPAISIEPEISRESRIVIDEPVFSYFRYVTERIKEPDDSIEAMVLGNIIGLRAPKEALLNEAGERIVTVRGISSSTGPITINISMDLGSYMHAYQAHGQTRDVKIRCRLRKRQRGWELVEVIEWKFIE